MSRTKKGAKGPGHEYAGKRPERYWHFPPGRGAKKWTHGAERREGAKEAALPPLYAVCTWCGKDFPVGEDDKFVGHLRGKDGGGHCRCPGSGTPPANQP